MTNFSKTRVFLLAAVLVIAVVAIIPLQGCASVSSVTITTPIRTIHVGVAVPFAAHVSGSGNFNNAVTWSSSNPAVATVNAEGVLTGVTVGTTNLTATSVGNTSVSDTVAIAVAVGDENITGVTIQHPGVLPRAILNENIQLTAIVSYAEGTTVNTDVIWYSSNPAAATITATGMLRGVADGASTNIRATAVDNSAVYHELTFLTITPDPLDDAVERTFTEPNIEIDTAINLRVAIGGPEAVTGGVTPVATFNINLTRTRTTAENGDITFHAAGDARRYAEDTNPAFQTLITIVAGQVDLPDDVEGLLLGRHHMGFEAGIRNGIAVARAGAFTGADAPTYTGMDYEVFAIAELIDILENEGIEGIDEGSIMRYTVALPLVLPSEFFTNRVNDSTFPGHHDYFRTSTSEDLEGMIADIAASLLGGLGLSGDIERAIQDNWNMVMGWFSFSAGHWHFPVPNAGPGLVFRAQREGRATNAPGSSRLVRSETVVGLNVTIPRAELATLITAFDLGDIGNAIDPILTVLQVQAIDLRIDLRVVEYYSFANITQPTGAGTIFYDLAHLFTA